MEFLATGKLSLRIYIKVPYLVPFAWTFSIVGSGLWLVVGLQLVLVNFFCIFSFSI